MIWIGDVLVSPGEGGVYGERMLEGHRVWDRRTETPTTCSAAVWISPRI